MARDLLLTGGAGLCLVLGPMMLVLAGPGLPFVALGLALLAVEHVWARRALRVLKTRIAQLGAAARTRLHPHDTEAAATTRPLFPKEEDHAHQANRS